MNRAKLINEVMAAICNLVPPDDGSHWSPTAAPEWPKDYSRSEIALRRAIATVAVSVLMPHTANDTPAQP